METELDIASMRIIVTGSSPDTGNLGVTALSAATLCALHKADPGSDLCLFDFGKGVRESVWEVGGTQIHLRRCGGYVTRRIYRAESLWCISLCARLGGFGNPGAYMYLSADVILDVTAGDSFSDIYGQRRFRAVTRGKRFSLALGKPLILMPQTYGPFQAQRNQRIAAEIVRGSTMAWARDEHSFAVLKSLLGDAFDSERHRSGVDVAFGLPTTAPAEDYLGAAGPWLAGRNAPLVGLNVSGLLMNRPESAAKQFGFTANYTEVVISLARRLLKETGAHILLIPHVVSPPGHYESDIEAGDRVAEAVADVADGRVLCLPALHNPCEVKWVIAQCDWFCGTRMHATIAALSSGVPAAAIAYSPKTLGVFESCGQGAHVADPRMLDTEEMVEQLWQSWLTRDEARQSLRTVLTGVLRRAEEQMGIIIAECIRHAEARQKGTVAP